jgi:hypothetical protein
MRMWMIEPSLLCDKHLLGEHGELHKHRHNFEKKHSIKGRIEPVVQVEPSAMQSRHDELAAEMVKRGMNHRSPYEMPDISYLPVKHRQARVNVIKSIYDLGMRCEACRNRILSESKLSN